MPAASPGARLSAAKMLDEAGFVAAADEIRSWPSYRATPLRRLDGPASDAGVESVWYKDEGTRFGTGSFKALGGPYAVRRVLDRAASAGREPVTVACATAGNHGAAVAWGAGQVGCRCVVFLPEGASEARETSLLRLGAEVRRTGMGYDATVTEASAVAAREGWTIVSDTTEAKDPEEAGSVVDVMQGYRLLVEEALEQLSGAQSLTHVVVQAGVGGLAAAVCEHLRARFGAARPALVVVEAATAACLLESARAGRRRILDAPPRTGMKGLACRTPSALAWEILRTGVRGFLTVSDAEEHEVIRALAGGWPGGGRSDPPVVAGASGAAGLAGLLAAARAPELAASLGLDRRSRVLVVGTEGATDPEAYARIVGAAAESAPDGTAGGA